MTDVDEILRLTSEDLQNYTDDQLRKLLIRISSFAPTDLPSLGPTEKRAVSLCAARFDSELENEEYQLAHEGHGHGSFSCRNLPRGGKPPASHRYTKRRRKFIAKHGLSPRTSVDGHHSATETPRGAKIDGRRKVDGHNLVEDVDPLPELSETEIQEWMESVSTRIMSLPNMVCEASCGSLYMIPVDHVQECVHKTHLGAQGVRASAKLQNAILGRCQAGNGAVLRKASVKRVHGTAKLDASKRRDSLKGGHLDLVGIDPELEERLNKTLEIVSRHREELRNEWTRQKGEQEQAEKPEDSHEDEVAAPAQESPKKPTIHKKGQRPSFLPLIVDFSSSSDDEAEPTPSPIAKLPDIKLQQWRGVVRKIQRNWNRLAKKKNRTVAIKQGMKFSDVFSTEDLQSLWSSRHHGKSRFQGTGVYETKCVELGIRVNTQVLHNLQKIHCDLSECGLGQRGIEALAPALASNTIIRELNLSENNIDGKSAGILMRGILTSIGHTGRLLEGDEKKKMKQQKPPTSKWHAPKTLLRNRGLGKLTAALNRANDIQTRVQNATGGGTPRNLDFNGKVHSIVMSSNPLCLPGAKLFGDCLDPDRLRREFLTSLDLSKCNIPDAGGVAIARALQNGNVLLQNLCLARNDISDSTAKAFGELFECNHTLLTLDLSWNVIKHTGAKHLARGLQSNATLRSLNLSWNGFESTGVMHMGEMLQVNLGLKQLDLSSTRAGPDACLVLAEGLKVNNVLEVLLLDNNPVTESGARHLMLALGSNSSVKYLGLQGSNLAGSTALAQGNGGGNPDIAASFNPSMPDNHYILNLGVPAERAVALQLCQLDVQSSENLLKNIKLDGMGIATAKRAGWPERLPTHGTLVADFESAIGPVFLQTFTDKQLETLEPQFTKRNTTDEHRFNIAAMVCPHYFFTCDQVVRLLRHFAIGDGTIMAAEALMSRTIDFVAGKERVLEALSDRDANQLRVEMGQYMFFNPDNPTGHYEFDLTQMHHRFLVTRIRDIANAEAPAPTFRNIVYDHIQQTKIPVSRGPPILIRGGPPTTGTFAFDFVSFEELPDSAVAIPDEDLEEVVDEAVGKRDASNGLLPGHGNLQTDEICRLRERSDLLIVTAEQVTGIIDRFEASPMKVEVATLFCTRIVDRHNLWKIVYHLNCLEQSCLMTRLGPDVCFDPKHCTGHFLLDITNPLHEEVAKKLVNIASQQETDIQSIWNLRLTGKKKQVHENSNLWAALTTETSYPVMEFDFFGPDAFQLLGKSAEDAKAMHSGDRLDTRARQAKRKEHTRLQQMYGYWMDNPAGEEEYNPPDWATYESLNKPLVSKSLALAAWDRHMRKLLRLDVANGVEGDSPLEDLFDEFTEVEGRMTWEEFQDLLTTGLGYTRTDTVDMRKVFDRESSVGSGRRQPVGASTQHGMQRRGSVVKSMQPVPYISFKTFSKLFMTYLTISANQSQNN